MFQVDSLLMYMFLIWDIFMSYPNTLDGYIFTPLQLLDERNAVEQLAVHIPGY